MMLAGKHRKGPIDWNPRPEIEFSHAVEDGSDHALNEMVEKIWSKYDLNENN